MMWEQEGKYFVCLFAFIYICMEGVTCCFQKKIISFILLSILILCSLPRSRARLARPLVTSGISHGLSVEKGVNVRWRVDLHPTRNELFLFVLFPLSPFLHQLALTFVSTLFSGVPSARKIAPSINNASVCCPEVRAEETFVVGNGFEKRVW